jgi:hypothetical protein
MARPTLKKKRTSLTGRPAVAVKTTKIGQAEPSAERPEHASGRWTFLTNHSHVLIVLWRHPSMVLREVAASIGITERAVQRIIVDLQEGGFIQRDKVGRQNHYRIIRGRHLRHAVEAHCTIGDLLRIIDRPR